MKTEASKSAEESLLAFASNLYIPSQEGLKWFGDCMSDFQSERFLLVAKSADAVRKGERPPDSRFWWEATKGAAKDADLAIVVLWMMRYALRPLHIQIAAGDREQAGIVKDRVEGILYENPDLKEHITIFRNMVWCSATRCKADVIPAEAKTGHGSTPDVLVLNELHVTKREFAETMMDNADKVSRGIAIVATNAGFLGTWQNRWRSLAMESPRWVTHIFSKPSPWTTEEALEDARKRNTDRRYKRLWWGIWGTEEGDGLPIEDIEWMMKRYKGPLKNDGGYPCVGGFDFGLKHDHAAFVVVQLNFGTKKYRIAKSISWKPREFHDGQISPAHVQQEVWATCKQFRVLGVAFDPYQFVGSAEWLSSQYDQATDYQVSVTPAEMTAKRLSMMATTLLSVLRNRELEGYPDDELRTDLLKLAIEERMGGYKLVAAKDEETGHADRAMALAIILPHAVVTMNDYLEQLPGDDSPVNNY